jgi:hypothetical protein
VTVTSLIDWQSLSNAEFAPKGGVLHSAANPAPPTSQSHFALQNASTFITQKQISAVKIYKLENIYNRRMNSHFILFA